MREPGARGPGDRAGAGGPGAHAGEGGPGGPGSSTSPYKPGALWILADKKPERVELMTGITDGAATEIRTDKLKEGDLVIVGLEMTQARSTLAPPPGMGGPGFRGPGGGGGRR